MAFDARWDSIGFNYGGLLIAGDAERYEVRWGDGTRERVSKNRDETGDGVPDVATVGHGYADGAWTVTVGAVGGNDSAQRLRMFAYSERVEGVSVRGGALRDIVVTGSGDDVARLGDGDDWFGAAGGNDRADGGTGSDVLLGDAGDDRLAGGDGGDLIGGGGDNDRLYGDGGRDFLYGDAGDDLIYGGADDDYLEGGAGYDRLYGGDGADVFEIAPGERIDGAPVDDPFRDLVGDFVQGVDRLSVDQWFAAGAYDFVGTARFSGAGPELSYRIRGGETLVSGDIDGDRIADFTFRIAGEVTLTVDDFTI